MSELDGAPPEPHRLALLLQPWGEDRRQGWGPQEAAPARTAPHPRVILQETGAEAAASHDQVTWALTRGPALTACPVLSCPVLAPLPSGVHPRGQTVDSSAQLQPQAWAAPAWQRPKPPPPWGQRSYCPPLGPSGDFFSSFHSFCPLMFSP